MEFQYFSSIKKIKITLVQFPLKLSFAITSHAAQGMTIRHPTKLKTSFNDLFDAGMGYVIISRLQKLDQLFLEPFPMYKLYCSKKARSFTQQLYERAINFIPSSLSQCTGLTVASLNVRNLSSHLSHLKKLPEMENIDLLCVQETWLTDQDLTLNTNYNTVFLNCGSRGLAIFYRNTLSPIDIVKITTSSANFIVMIFTGIIIINVYQFSGKSNVTNFHNIINQFTLLNLPLLIVGDLNVDVLNGKNKNWIESMKNFTQHVQRPTHLEGGLIDHVYSCNFESNSYILTLIEQKYIYFSDHTLQVVEVKTNTSI